MASSKRTLQEANGAAGVESATTHPSKKRKSAKKDANGQAEKQKSEKLEEKEEDGQRAAAPDAGDNDEVVGEAEAKKLKKEEKRRRKEERKERKARKEREQEVEVGGDEAGVNGGGGAEANGEAGGEGGEEGDKDEGIDAKAARKEKRRRLKEAEKEVKKAAKKAAKEEAKKEANGENGENGVDEKAGKTKAKKSQKSARPEKEEETTEKESTEKEPVDGPTYVQSAALSKLPQSDIDAFLAKESVTITDPTPPSSTGGVFRPILDFSHLPQTTLLSRNPFSAYKAPTPIQAASWPYTLSGRDVVGVAETGSGKTMAFALPCVEAVVRARARADKDATAWHNKRGKKTTIRAVVVSPTRELAMQTHEQMAGLARHVGLECVCIFGGASKDAQRTQLARADIVVATPGRLKDFMADGAADLRAAAFVVLDEADRMLDKGFEEDIKLIVGQTPPRGERQTLMFTATWPDSVRALAASFMVAPVKLTIGSASRETASGAVELQANSRIAQTVEVVDPYGKEGRVLQIIRQRQQVCRTDRILVFCLYKKEATRIEGFLAAKGVKVVGIHGDLKQEQRTRSLEAFKTGNTPVLVATDVAARGLDIPEVKLVLNVTFPLTIEDYVHRIGRTGRAGKSGEAITLFTVQDKAHSGSLINILKAANQPVPEELLKFGTTVKKKVHPIYGAFFKEQDPAAKTQAKITFDD